jgi:hypothetical protein
LLSLAFGNKPWKQIARQDITQLLLDFQCFISGDEEVRASPDFVELMYIVGENACLEPLHAKPLENLCVVIDAPEKNGLIEQVHTVLEKFPACQLCLQIDFVRMVDVQDYSHWCAEFPKDVDE